MEEEQSGVYSCRMENMAEVRSRYIYQVLSRQINGCGLGVLSSITPHSVKGLRGLINDSVLDIMFYLSPRYGPEVTHNNKEIYFRLHKILDGLRWQLHKKHNEFMSRNDSFISSGGTVSLFAHSLGSVMCYDLLIETCRMKGLLTDYTESSKMEVDPIRDHTGTSIML